jgi:hypothetical protein
MVPQRTITHEEAQMRAAVLAIGVCLVLGSSALSVTTSGVVAQQAAPAGGSQPVAKLAADLDWMDLDPQGAPGVKIARLWGDHTKGAFGAFLKLPAGFVAPLHTHTHDMRLVFVSGTYLQRPEGKPEMRLTPGSYLMQPGGTYRHVTSCDTGADCVFFFESDGPFDLKIVQQPQGPGRNRAR